MVLSTNLPNNQPPKKRNCISRIRAVLRVTGGPTLSELLNISIATLYIAKRIRQFLKNFVKKPTKVAFKKLAKANKSNAAKATIAEHCVVGLKEALEWEKKKRREGRS
jgi:DNA-binding transcriptional regulator WhiA